MIALLSHEALEDIALGATVIGSGDRGDPTLGKLHEVEREDAVPTVSL